MFSGNVISALLRGIAWVFEANRIGMSTEEFEASLEVIRELREFLILIGTEGDPAKLLHLPSRMPMGRMGFAPLLPVVRLLITLRLSYSIYIPSGGIG